jgi:hypothetical protein
MTGQNKYESLREKHPEFCYESFDIQRSQQEILLTFHFSMGTTHSFNPGLRIPFTGDPDIDPVHDLHFQNLAFHIGMIELISYWKLSCSPRVIIKAGYLSQKQVDWFLHLYYNGMGEFFHVNGIKPDLNTFMDLRVDSDRHYKTSRIDLENACFIPVGGGKDSVVSLELLKERMDCTPFALNPRKAIEDCIETAGFPTEKAVRYYRSLDPLMLEMNAQGYLNGHTPFSALLAFISLTAACLWKKKYIMLSNEASANEPTIPGTNINHQYSKSLEFESAFRAYTHEFISPDYEYLSFLRPFNELQIARQFSGFPQYHAVFRSCNAGSKEDKWCGQCSKCLFAAIILSPFLQDSGLNAIFGYPILDNAALISDLHKLTGNSPEKPFECIGTLEEVNMALCEAIRQRSELPFLLREYQKSPAFLNYKDVSFAGFMELLNEDHYLSPDLFDYLKHRYYENQAD